MSLLNNVNQATFKAQVIDQAQPVLVDFYADWCGPCHVQTPVLEALASEFKEKLSVVKVNIDEDIDLAQAYNIRSIPTLILFKQGAAVDVRVGASSRNDLIKVITAHV